MWQSQGYALPLDLISTKQQDIFVSCPSAQKYPKCWHDRRTQIRQKQHSRKTFCDPSFSNQTAGAVTQCSSGFYREWVGPNRGQCVPCSCNGLPDECDERTGNCVKCQFNTTGNRCERCKEGYFGDPVNRTCRACPCPFTENNFALACLDVGSGVVECLCKHGYSGVRCERCAFGYYGNPMVHGGMCKPCNCKKNGLNMCDSLTGECITSGNSNCGDHCHECDSCTYTLLVDSEKMDDDLVWLKQQLQNINHNPVSQSTLNNLEANISEAKVQMGRHKTAVRLLDPKVEQLEADVAADRYDLSQLNLIKQLTEAKPEDSVSLSEKDKGRMMEEAQRIIELGELLLDAEDRVDRARGLNLKSRTALQHLQEFEKRAAQLDGAQLEHFQQLNNSLIIAEVEAIAQAEEHAKELKRVVTELQQALHTATNSTSLVSLLGIGAYDSIIKAVEMVEKAAKESKRAADQTLKDVKKRGLISRSEQLKDNSSHLWRETRDTQSHLKTVSRTVNAHRNRVNKQKKKRRSLRIDASSISDKLKKIKRDDTAALIVSVKTAASDANATVSSVKERLRNISEEVGRITLTNISVNINDMLTDADQAVKSFNKALPVMSDKLAEVKALGRRMSPHPNMTESIQRIKDIIEETRNFVNRLSLGTAFNGKSHIELHPPRDLEDIKAFTAVDLLLNRHHKTPAKSDVRRKRHQDEHRDANLFVFYLGSKNASGDYIGMAIRNTVLVCVYKLGGVVHEIETSQITLGSVNSSALDRVIFHRVYQDAEVNVTKNFTSKERVSLPPKRNLPNTMTGVFDLDPGSVVFYVGGYPDYFTPPVELRYPKYRGAIKLSYLNDNPVCLFNFKHAVNMDAKQLTVKIAQEEVSDYYEGRGYRMAFIKNPDWKKRRLFRFHTNSRETNALLFYIGNNESFFCVFVERGFLVLQGQQTDREIRLRSAERVSLFDTQFAIAIADKFIVQYGPKTVSTDHIQTDYISYYIGGLPAELRERHNITAAPLRGCVDNLKADAEIVEYNRTIGVSSGCPVSSLGVRAATLNSALSVDSLFAWDKQPVRVSLGFRTTGKRGVVLKSGSQGSETVHNLQLSLDDGFVVFHSFNYTLRSNERYNDGIWHYVSAVGKPSGLLLSIDNVNVSPAHSDQISMQRGKFKGCIANLYTSRPSILPADLSSLSQTGDIIFDQCSQPPPPHSTMKRPQTHNLITTPAGSQCRPQRAYQLYEKDSWVSYNLPQENLNYSISCIREFKMNDVFVGAAEVSHKALPCFDGLAEEGTYFGGGHIVLDNYFTIGSHFLLSFKLRPQHLTGLLFHVQSDKTSLNVFLMENKVGVKANDGNGAVSVSVTPRKSLCDGKFHEVTVSKKRNAFQLVVDSMSKEKAGPKSTSYSTALESLHIGGTTNHNGAPVPSPFVGCLRNVKINGKPVAFEKASRVVGPVSINRCPTN
ncbi:laminin subunit alpha-3 [Neolamprologus brichardi]|uniref:laminin subunit alpha-3 n=1 Tax=Neolamprologus brichardi TaxID=32507 RepID=UPI001643C167|nr:laminin subunit alpha-3 [Neolamprologus brichardi]